MPKARRTIPENDVDRIFDASCIRGLAERSKISKEADIEKLGNGPRATNCMTKSKLSMMHPIRAYSARSVVSLTVCLPGPIRH